MASGQAKPGEKCPDCGQVVPACGVCHECLVYNRAGYDDEDDVEIEDDEL